jgi:hypothetical protein
VPTGARARIGHAMSMGSRDSPTAFPTLPRNKGAVIAPAALGGGPSWALGAALVAGILVLQATTAIGSPDASMPASSRGSRSGVSSVLGELVGVCPEEQSSCSSALNGAPEAHRYRVDRAHRIAGTDLRYAARGAHACPWSAAPPLAFGTGLGSDLRRPLGITRVGGLLVSQLLTVFTTPERLSRAREADDAARSSPRAPARLSQKLVRWGDARQHDCVRALRTAGWILAALSLAPACGRPQLATVAATSAPVDQATSLPETSHPEPEMPFTAWLKLRLPSGGSVTSEGGSVAVEHLVTADDTALTIAKAYLDLTDVYFAKDLAGEITKRHPNLAVGDRIAIPHLLAAPYKTPEEDRLRWPDDRAMKGVFISGIFAGAFWPETLERLASHGLNAVVLDAKDYMGTVNYPTQVPLAKELGAFNDPPIADYARAIRFAHARGIRVIARIPCFHDPWAAKHAPRLSLMASSGRPFQMGWTDPSNTEVQDYIVALTREVIDLGADEVQLDYVRFPVQSIGIAHAVMPAPDGHRSRAMKEFVRRVHEVTQARKIPLSLDVFGVTATGEPSDIEALGQNLAILGSETEVLSPMVYPSHYAPGWSGFDVPGSHPEIIGIGTRAALGKLKAGHLPGTLIRPWLQASSYKTPNYGPQYIRDEIKSAETSGAVGWLMWDPSNSYWAVWGALPRVSGDASTKRDGSGAGDQASRPPWRATMSSSAGP